MNARYPSVWGTQNTPIIAYYDQNPPGEYQEYRAVVAYDVGGWGAGVFDNVFPNDGGTADTVLHDRYVSVRVAPDDPDFWVMGTYHSGDPGEMLLFYYSEDGGINWKGPKVLASSIEADTNKPYYVADLSTSGLGISAGSNGVLFATGLCQYEDDDNDLWRIIYMTSNDKGQTWSPPSLIPGTENLSFANGNIYRQFTEPIQDKSGNWHIFAVGVDTSISHGVNFPEPFRAWDFVYDGSTWTINQIVVPQLLENGINAWGDYPDDIEQYAMNDPAIGPDGTLYYVYSDVVDTTGSMDSTGAVDVSKFEFNMFVIFSEDNGNTWEGPVPILKSWKGMGPNGVARFATDKLHVVYRKHNEDVDDEFYYMGVPTDTIKSMVGVDSRLEKVMPRRFRLRQNFPNPFNPTTTIRFDLKEDAVVTLTVYNALGQEVAKLIDHKYMQAGFKGITFNGYNLPSGTYFYRLEAGDFVDVKKMVLLK